MAKGLGANSLMMLAPNGISVSSVIEILCSNGLKLSIGSLSNSNNKHSAFHELRKTIVFCFVTKHFPANPQGLAIIAIHE